MADPFDLPAENPKTTSAIRAAVAYVGERIRRHADARETLKGLAQHHSASITHPTYRTALRCCGIYCEAATSCDLATAKLLVASFVEKADSYRQSAGNMDLFDGLEVANG